MPSDSKYIWLNETMTMYQDAKAHILAHTLQYGTGVFEGLRAYKCEDGRTRVFRAREHFERLHNSAKFLDIHIPYTSDKLMDATRETILKNGFEECYIRPVAFIDDSFRGLKLPNAAQASVAIATWPWGQYLGADSQQKGIRVMISTYRRGDVASSIPWAKICGGYVLSVLARREASTKGFDEAILLDQSGFVAEGSGENIFVIKHGKLLTPRTHSILPGITRDSIITLASEMKLKVEEQDLTRSDLLSADELFFTGTAVEVTPIREVDGQMIGNGKPGSITQKLAERFFNCVRGKYKEKSHWLMDV